MRPLRGSDPMVVASYRLLGVLGRGGMGDVYLGRSKSGRLVAIKVVRQDLAEDEGFRRRFAREVEAVRAVSPLFSAAVVDADTEAEQPWLATMYIEGPTLEQRVADRGPMSLGAALTLAAGLAEALSSIHRAGLVHRDLKPSNVVLNDAGPHIIDFGIALGPQSAKTTTLLLGTPSYMAPERLKGGDGTPPGDVFAFGATLFFALAGRDLVNGATTFIKIMQVTEGRFDLSGLPKQLRPVIVRCISHRPKDRPTAEELTRILAASGAAVPEPGWYEPDARTTEPPGAVVPARLGPRWSRRRLLAASGVIGATGAAVGVTSLLLRGEPAAERAFANGTAVPGHILWYGRSGAPLAQTLTAPAGVSRIVVTPGRRIITAQASDVVATDGRGSRLWTHPLPASPLRLYGWGDAVLVSGGTWLWLLDPVSGEEKFAMNAATPGPSPTGRAIAARLEIGRVAVAADRAFVSLGTATIAVGRDGREVWRNPVPTTPDGLRPAVETPAAADAKWLATHDPVGSMAVVALHDAATGFHRWSARYEVTPFQPPPGGPSGPPGGPPPGGGPGGPPGGPQGGPGGPPPGGDDAWALSEARMGETHLVVRDANQVRALTLSGGSTAWQRSSEAPVVSIDLAGELALISADRLRACSLTTGVPAWAVHLPGARTAYVAGRGTIIAASERTISALDLGGQKRWQTPIPDLVDQATPDRIFVHGDIAYVTFKPFAGRTDPLDVDVVAIALGP